MIKQRLIRTEPIIGVRPYPTKLHSKPNPNIKYECEIELCCNCSEPKCNGEPCERLKQAYKEKKEKAKENNNE